MSDNGTTTTTRNRREFLTSTVMAGGAAAVASVIPGDASAAMEKLTPATIALLPTPAQMQDFIALPDDHPIVMVNLLKFKPNGGQAEYAKYAAAIQPILEKLGAKMLFAGKSEYCLIGKADWDMVALVQYPAQEDTVSNVDVARVSGHSSLSGGWDRGTNQLLCCPSSGQGGVPQRSGKRRRTEVGRIADARRAVRASARLRVSAALPRGRRLPHALSRRGSAGRAAHSAAAWRADVVLPLSQDGAGRSSRPVTAASSPTWSASAARTSRSTGPCIRTSFTSTKSPASCTALDLKNCTFFGQDWGGLIGLRVVTENEGRFCANRRLEHRPADRRRTHDARFPGLETDGRANARRRRHARGHAGLDECSKCRA